MIPQWLLTPLSDMRAKRPALGPNLDALDGFRGLMVVVVLMDHCSAFGNQYRGGYGVIGFFVLSGFLLTQPFLHQTSLGWNSLASYFKRRLKRILPMYVAAVALETLVIYRVIYREPQLSTFSDRIEAFLSRVSFVLPHGHHWSVAQEMHFYALLPLLMGICLVVLRGSKGASSVFCFLLAVAGSRYSHDLPLHMRWSGGVMDLRFDIFLLGISAAFAVPFLTSSKIVMWWLYRLCWAILGGVALLFLVAGNHTVVACCVAPVPVVGGWLARGTLEMSDFGVGLLAVALLISLLVSQRGVLSRILGSPPLRILGVLGYSMYLVHPWLTEGGHVHQVGESLSGEARFGVVLVLAFLLASITYTYVERPLFKNSYRKMLNQGWLRLTQRRPAFEAGIHDGAARLKDE